MARKPLNIRAQVIALLSRPGIPHTHIAKSLNCSIRTINRIAKDIHPALDQVDIKLAAFQSEMAKVITIQQRVEKYANLATSATNEAVSLGALQRIDDLDGIVTAKERLRRQPIEASQAGPMFVFPQGTHIDFGGLTIQTTTKKKDDDE